MVAFLAARSCSSHLPTRHARIQRPQVSGPIAVRPTRAQRVVTRAVVAPDTKLIDLGITDRDQVEIELELQENLGVSLLEPPGRLITTVGEVADWIAERLAK